MSTLENAYYRSYQAVFDKAARVLPWRKAVRVQGPGSIRHLPRLLRLQQKHKPMVVTDPGLVRAGIAAKITDVLKKAGVPYALYSGVEPNPSVHTVDAIQKQFLLAGCDSFIALGGGSAMDAAKAAGARVVFPEKTVQQLQGLLRVWRPLPCFIAIPTTAGTGSETTIAALITDTDTGHKSAIMDLHLIPRYAVLDPCLTTGLPPAVTAATGMDALTHGVEAYLCWTYNTQESIRFAQQAVHAIFQNLEAAYKDGSDLRARGAMQVAAYKAGFAFTRAGVGNVHAIAHTLGGLYGTAHGLANAVILPIVLEDYGPAVHEKLAHLAARCGLATGGGTADDAEAFIAAIRDMNRRMNIPESFDFIKEADIPQMVEWALKEANPLYPVPVIYDAQRFERVIRRVRGEAAK